MLFYDAFDFYLLRINDRIPNLTACIDTSIWKASQSTSKNGAPCSNTKLVRYDPEAESVGEWYVARAVLLPGQHLSLCASTMPQTWENVPGTK